MDQDSRRTGRPARRTGWVSSHHFFLSLDASSSDPNRSRARADPYLSFVRLTIIEIMTSRIYHRFTLDEKDKVQALRLFKVSPRFPLTHVVISSQFLICVWLLSGRTNLNGSLTLVRKRWTRTLIVKITSLRSRLPRLNPAVSSLTSLKAGAAREGGGGNETRLYLYNIAWSKRSNAATQ